MLFKLSNLNSNLALTLGYLNPALNNSALEFPTAQFWALSSSYYFINDLPLTWNRNGLFADDATFYASASNLTDVQVQLQRDLSNTETWTKDGCPSAKDKIHDNWYSTKAFPLQRICPFAVFGW